MRYGKSKATAAIWASIPAAIDKIKSDKLKARKAHLRLVENRKSNS